MLHGSVLLSLTKYTVLQQHGFRPKGALLLTKRSIAPKTTATSCIFAVPGIAFLFCNSWQRKKQSQTKNKRNLFRLQFGQRKKESHNNFRKIWVFSSTMQQGNRSSGFATHSAARQTTEQFRTVYHARAISDLPSCKLASCAVFHKLPNRNDSDVDVTNFAAHPNLPCVVGRRVCQESHVASVNVACRLQLKST